MMFCANDLAEDKYLLSPHQPPPTTTTPSTTIIIMAL